MKHIIRKILSEEINKKLKKSYKKISNYIIDNVTIKPNEKIRYSNGIDLIKKEIGYYQPIKDIIYHNKKFEKLGWVEYLGEDSEWSQDYYFYKKNNPDEHFTFNEFKVEISYEFLDHLVEIGELNFINNSYVLNYPDLLIKINGFNTGFKLYRDPIKQEYELLNYWRDIYSYIGEDILRVLINNFGFNEEESLKIFEIFEVDLINKLKEEGINLIKSKNLNESIIDDFIDFGKKELLLGDDFLVNLTNNSDGIETLANYDMSDNKINVITKNRAVPDIIRSIAHEMVHHKQKTRGDLRGIPEEGEDGSPWEDEANSKSGELVRKFGRDNPSIYDL